MHRLIERLSRGERIVLDGAMATELEKMGYDLNDELWSAKLLMDHPEAIEAVHVNYLEAGAEILITSSYQATFEGFEKKGIPEKMAIDLLKRSTQLAKAAVEVYGRDCNGHKPYVAASVGPYGAFLADGSEYRGHYEIDDQKLYDFHLKRFKTLEDSQPDLYAFETIPCLQEAKVLCHLLHEESSKYGWMSFSCKDGKHISSGETIEEVSRYLDEQKQIFAIGINCTAPEFVSDLIGEIRRGSNKTIIVYPNLGEVYDPMGKTWLPIETYKTFLDYIPEWFRAGAQIIGGCCRTSPADISKVAKCLEKKG